MVKVLILEDTELARDRIRGDIPEGVDVSMVVTQAEFWNYLREGGDADLYFLDDQVPERIADDLTDVARRFVETAGALLEDRPGARIFYSGGKPNQAAITFCESNGIEILAKKYDIGSVIRREFPDLE